ncbi:hypothetical protein EDB89DRAFT_2076909 [Lactarius sanguifluus]|nr:hypothetical protein EDB89DRAFT_2076909 [Lactarius sanguifluus]
MRNLQNRPPSTQVRRADDLLNEAMQVLEQHREVTNEEDYNMERALLTSTRGFRNGEERDRSITAISYLDKAHKTLETVKVTLESGLHHGDHYRLRRHIKRHALSSTTTPAAAFTTASLASSASIRGPTLQVVLTHIRPPPSFGLPSPPDDQFPQKPAALYDEIAPISTTAVKEARPSVNPAIVVSPLPTPPLTPETPAKPSPENSTHMVL